MDIFVICLRLIALVLTFSALAIPQHAFLALFFLWISITAENVGKMVDNR